MIYYLPINPCPAPRQSRRDRWIKRPCVERYHAFRDRIAEQKIEQKIVLPESPWLWFLIPIPRSWSKRKRADLLYQAHALKPDVDNLLKAFLDGVFRDENDSHVWDLRVTKIWSQAGAIVVASAEASDREVRKFIEEQQCKRLP